MTPLIKRGESYRILLATHHNLASDLFTQLCATLKTAAQRSGSRELKLEMLVKRGRPAFTEEELAKNLATLSFTLHDTPAPPFLSYLEVRWSESNVSFTAHSQSASARARRSDPMKLKYSLIKREPKRIKRVIELLARRVGSLQGVIFMPGRETLLDDLVFLMNHVGDYPLSIVPPTTR